MKWYTFNKVRYHEVTHDYGNINTRTKNKVLYNRDNPTEG